MILLLMYRGLDGIKQVTRSEESSLKQGVTDDTPSNTKGCGIGKLRLYF